MATLTNPGDTPAPFQWTTDEPNKGVFRIEPQQGTIPKHGTAQVAVRFHPGHAVAFAKRVFCLVEHQAPLGLDLMGTGYEGDGGERPPTICPRHIDTAAATFAREPQLRKVPPERLEELLAQREKDTSAGRRRSARFAVTTEQPLPATPTSQPPATDAAAVAVPSPRELFSRFIASSSQSGVDPGFEVHALEDFIDFGQCVADKGKGKTTTSDANNAPLRVRNTTLGRITCVWVSNTASTPDTPFTVFPTMAELEPNQTYTFKVSLPSFLSSVMTLFLFLLFSSSSYFPPPLRAFFSSSLGRRQRR
jgi:hypothetical protein